MSILRRRLDAVMVRDVDHDVLILDTESDLIHQLNQTASFIWRKCEEVPSATTIAELLATEFEVETDTALRDVLETLNRLKALNLVVEA